MSFGIVSKRTAMGVACLLTAPIAMPCVAAVPPVGYVGEMPRVEGQAIPTLMPLGYTGEVPRPQTSRSLRPAAPASDNHEDETLITSQQMHSDSATGIMLAMGKVEIVHGDHMLHADTVTYNQKTGVMTADGHVVLLMPSGEVEFADHQEISGDMKQAFAERIGILYPDNSRVAAVTAERYEGRYTVANHAMYTACNVCRENPDNPPLWQLKADTITHDNTEHEIYYHNATIEFADVPVAYTPYLSTPDPTVKRQQGFLSPMPGYSTNIGEYLKTPYYVDIAPDKDMTITPTFSTIDKAQLAAQYRQRFASGALQLDGSLTRADLIDDSGVYKGQKWRGAMFGTFQYDLNSTWRTGTDLQYVSDKSYLHRYQISSLDQTISRAYVEGFKGRDYMALNSYHFQDLRAGSSTAEPLVLPSATFSALGDPGQALGGRWSFDGNTLVTTRSNTRLPITQQGPDTRRLSTNAGWQRQLTSDTGLVTTVSGLMRTDSYWANHVVASDGSGSVYNQALFTREFGQGNAVMRYPLGRSGEGYQQLMEPIVALTAAPTVRVSAKQPVEDSRDIEFDETNLFSPNRFTGSDLIEGGSRITYGIRNAVTMDSGARIDVFGGESYNFTPDNAFPALSGLNAQASDYVGRVDFAPVDWFNANYGFRLAQGDLSPQRQDALVSFGAPIFRPSIRYIEAYETNPTTNLIDQVRQITFSFSSNFTKYWTLTGSHVQAFDPQPGPRSTGLALTYADECFAFGIDVNRNDLIRADVSSGTSVAFHLYLKNLGGMHTDSSSEVSFPAEFRQTAP